MKKFTARTVLIAAAILVLLMSAAYAAFSSQVTEFFGKLYGKDTLKWLEGGDAASANQSFEMDGVVFTVDEVIYRKNGLYGVGAIRVKEGANVVLIAEDYMPDAPYGYDVYGAGGAPEMAPDDAPSTADVVRKKNAKLLVVRALPDEIGVDGGTLLAPGSIGYTLVPQHDGSVRFSFEVEDAYAVGEGSTFTIRMWSSTCEMTPDGEWLEDTRHGENWTVEISPTPMSSQMEAEAQQPAEKDAGSAELVSALLPDGVEIIVPDEYTRTGTMPIYRAEKRDLGSVLQPEWFNQSGIASRDEYGLTFNDEAQLSWAPEAVFYAEYSGTSTCFYENADTGESVPNTVPSPTLAHQISSLASWATSGWPGTGGVYTLEKTELMQITLEQAKATFEALLAKLNLTGYHCDYALDMSLERVQELGNDMNAQIRSGSFPNAQEVDYSLVTAEDEGYFLSYHRWTDTQAESNSDLFSAYAYVTPRGVEHASIRDMYAQGEVYDTPEKLVDPQSVIDALPGEIAVSRFPDGAVGSIASVRLTYQPMRAPDKKDGMVLSPVWVVSYYEDDVKNRGGYASWAEFNAVDGKLLNAIFQ
ncbi:MAG: DUF4179 domain-containing protein [Eubacteriales bacterium]|nr:DUF4179 domain-containing protein [Eubacteriales bacterium]